MSDIENIKARGIARVQFSGDEKDGQVAMVLTDTSQMRSGYLINPEALNILLSDLLGLATRWVEDPDLNIKEFTGQQRALPATHIEFAQGRDNSECAVRIFLGDVELDFLIDVNKVVSAFAGLRDIAEKDPDTGEH